MSVSVRDASTVLPLRDGPRGLEVYMVKRSSRLGFLGGAHVFPGGAVDRRDREQSVVPLLGGFTEHDAASLLGLHDPSRALGYVVAGIRELFEEAGVLVARDASGAWIELTGGSPSAGRLHAARAEVASGRASFADLVRDEGLTLAAGELHYFAHWITPESESKRFDTRFFVVEAPSGQRAAHDRGETTEGAWLTPQDALASYGRREIELVPPTICALDRLALHSSASEAIQAAAALDVVEVLPKICLDDGAVTILYPGDPDYALGEVRSEPFPPETGGMLTRLILRDGIWQKP